MYLNAELSESQIGRITILLQPLPFFVLLRGYYENREQCSVSKVLTTKSNRKLKAHQSKCPPANIFLFFSQVHDYLVNLKFLPGPS